MMQKELIRRHSTRIIGENSSLFSMARGRLIFMNAVFSLVFIFLGVRAFDLSVIQGDTLRNIKMAHIDAADRGNYEAESTGEKSALPAVPRANIYDRNGIMLATSLKTASLFADTLLIDDKQKTAQGLVEIFPDLSFGDVLKKLQSGKRFVWIERNILPHHQEKVLELGQPGLGFEGEHTRIYPQGTLTSHIVGYTDLDEKGQAGVERGLNNMLAKNTDLDLSLDIRLQHILRREMKKSIKDFNAIGGAGIIMNVKTGEVLAGVSLPDFDPHQAGNAKPDEIFNRMSLGVYELGSVFKIFSTAAFFETHNVPINTKFDATEPIKIGRFTINDYHAENRILTLPEVFIYSSNIGTGLMAQAIGNESLKNIYNDLGLLTPLSTEVKEIGRPMVPEPWGDVHTITASYGHGLATTPLQMTAAISTVLNGGISVKPRFTKMDQDIRAATEINTKLQSRVLSEKTAHRMRQLLRLNVTVGTGKKADAPGYIVGGKTGTAEKMASRGGYDKKKLMSSFVGAFPMNDPEYVIYVVIDEPKGNKASWGYATGGWVAAPVVGNVIKSMVAVLGIPPFAKNDEPDLSESLKIYVAEKKR